MVARTVDEDKKGQVVLLSSQDLVNWNFESVLARNDKDYGGGWECPDFFAIDGHKVLLVSPIENDDKESCQKVLTTFLVICYTPLYRKMTTIVVI